MKTYIDRLFTGLVPAKLVSKEGAIVKVRITETVGPYKKGEVIEALAMDFVHKVRIRDGFTMIRTVEVS